MGVSGFFCPLCDSHLLPHITAASHGPSSQLICCWFRGPGYQTSPVLGSLSLNYIQFSYFLPHYAAQDLNSLLLKLAVNLYPPASACRAAGITGLPACPTRPGYLPVSEMS